MRLRSIYLDDYRIIKDFTLDFTAFRQEEILESSLPHNYSLDLLVGVNGTGKSTLLRAIAEIFRRLYAASSIPFGFKISYELQTSVADTTATTLVTISNLDKEQPSQPLKGGYLRLKIDEGEDLHSEAAGISRDYLPSLVVAFTTGDEREWELPKDRDVIPIDNDIPGSQSSEQDISMIKDGLTSWFLSEIPSEPIDEQMQTTSTIETEKFLLIKEHYLPLVILCSMLDDINRSRQNESTTSSSRSKSYLHKVLEACNIKALSGFSLKFRMNQDTLSNPDYQFIRELSEFAQTIQTGSDYLLTFNLASNELQNLQKLISLRGNSLALFKELVRLSEPQNDNAAILQEVNLFLDRLYSKGSVQQESTLSPLHLLTWFSDGERSFLGRLCLLSLLGSDRKETLVLLDEPEVHFNDYWKRQLVSMIDNALGEQYSHVLMTTHSSITLSDVLNREIWVLRRSENRTQSATPPALRTLGADPSDIMVYVFDAEKATGAYSTALIERKLIDIANISEESEERTITQKRRALEALLKVVGPSDLRFLIRRELHALEEG